MDLFSGTVARKSKPAQFAMRPYQGECVDAVMDEFGRGVRSTLVVMATGLGKTVVFAEVAQRWLKRE